MKVKRENKKEHVRSATKERDKKAESINEMAQLICSTASRCSLTRA